MSDWQLVFSDGGARYLSTLLDMDNVSVNYAIATRTYAEFAARIAPEIFVPRQSVCFNTWRMTVELDKDGRGLKFEPYTGIIAPLLVKSKSNNRNGSEERASTFCFAPLTCKYIPRNVRLDNGVTARAFAQMRSWFTNVMEDSDFDSLLWVIGNGLIDPVDKPRIVYFYGQGGEGTIKPLQNDYVSNNKQLSGSDLVAVAEVRFVTGGDVELQQYGRVNGKFWKLVTGGDTVDSVVGPVTSAATVLITSNKLWSCYPDINEKWFTRRTMLMIMKTTLPPGATPPPGGFNEFEKQAFIAHAVHMRLTRKHPPVTAKAAIATMLGTRSGVGTRSIIFDDNAEPYDALTGTYCLCISSTMNYDVVIKLIESINPDLIRTVAGCKYIRGISWNYNAKIRIAGSGGADYRPLPQKLRDGSLMEWTGTSVTEIMKTSHLMGLSGYVDLEKMERQDLSDEPRKPLPLSSGKGQYVNIDNNNLAVFTSKGCVKASVNPDPKLEVRYHLEEFRDVPGQSATSDKVTLADIKVIYPDTGVTQIIPFENVIAEYRTSIGRKITRATGAHDSYDKTYAINSISIGIPIERARHIVDSLNAKYPNAEVSINETRVHNGYLWVLASTKSADADRFDPNDPGEYMAKNVSQVFSVFAPGQPPTPVGSFFTVLSSFQFNLMGVGYLELRLKARKSPRGKRQPAELGATIRNLQLVSLTEITSPPLGSSLNTKASAAIAGYVVDPELAQELLAMMKLTEEDHEDEDEERKYAGGVEQQQLENAAADLYSDHHDDHNEDDAELRAALAPADVAFQAAGSIRAAADTSSRSSPLPGQSPGGSNSKPKKR
ncbi:hypothetical protein HDV05_004413 [Chytridiales sp. JEL 0842]|nr:hypothetical protein HDV05_004413 [Chytridiales sp. JEL 0842]